MRNVLPAVRSSWCSRDGLSANNSSLSTYSTRPVRKSFRLSGRLDPKYPEVHSSLADALYKEGEIAEALAHWRETIRLDPGTTKYDDGRLAYLTPELKALLASQVARVIRLMRERRAVIPYLFLHLMG